MKPSTCVADGAEFDLANPRPESVNIEVIAHSLSLKARFGGHTSVGQGGVKRPVLYSVAQHACWVHDRVGANGGDLTDLAYGLFHDAAEAYLSDLPAPAKQLLPDFVALERRSLAVIYTAIGLDPAIEKTPAAEEADAAAIDAERSVYMPRVDWWPLPPSPPSVDVFWPSMRAKSEFLHRARRLVLAGVIKETYHA